MMFIDGEIIDAGDLTHGRGITIRVNQWQNIDIIGMTADQTKQAGRMLYHRVTLRVMSHDDADRFREELTTRRSQMGDEA